LAHEKKYKIFMIFAGRANVIGHGVGAVLGIAGLVWGSSTIQHQIQLQVATGKS
jgi:hypothetical protein